MKGCEPRMIPYKNEILQACQSIVKAVSEKSKEDVNPILIRIQLVLEEFQAHLHWISTLQDDVQQQKYHWSVLYRDGDILDEMTTLLNNTTPVFIQTEIAYIKQCLVFFTQHVVKTFGLRESMYIITPKFQELSDLW